MALFRALETLRSKGERLFDDPFARDFLAPSLRLALWIGGQTSVRVLCALIEKRWPGALTSGIARTRLIDDIASTAIIEGTRQIVLLGAGFDARPYRLSGINKVVVYEVDHPLTSARKQRVMRRTLGGIPMNVHFVPVDLNRDNLEAALEEAGYDFSIQTLFIWEGVTNYLAPCAVDATFRCYSNAVRNSQIVFTYIDEKVLTDPGAFYGVKSVGRALSKANERWTFGIDPQTIGRYSQERGFVLEIDRSAGQYRQTYYGKESDKMKGYEFYQVAVARVRD